LGEGPPVRAAGQECPAYQFQALFTVGLPFVIKKIEGLVFNEGKMKMEESEMREENRKIRFLRFLIDFSILSIQQNDLSLEEALKIVEDAKCAACNLFPGKEETFELIYRPRFRRVIEERFGNPHPTLTAVS
jgi:hypothetical protein